MTTRKPAELDGEGESSSPVERRVASWRTRFLEEPTHEARLHYATSELAEMTGAARCSIVVPLGSSGLRVVASSEISEVGDLIVARERYPELEHVLTHTSSLLVPDTDRSDVLAPVASLMRAAGVVSIAATPLAIHGVTGVLKVTSRDRSFDDRTLAVLEAAAAALQELEPGISEEDGDSWFQLVVSMADVVVDVSTSGRITRAWSAPDAEGGLRGIEPETALQDLLLPTDAGALNRILLDLFEGRPATSSSPLRLRDCDDDPRTARLHGVLLPSAPPSARVALRLEPRQSPWSVFDDVPLALVQIGPDGGVERMNRAARELSEPGDASPIGMPLEAWLHCDDHGTTFWPASPDPVPVKVVDPGGGSRVVALIDLSPWHRVLAHQRQMRSTLQAQIQELEELNRRLEEADVVKARFLSGSAHELKTPLTIIQSYLEILVSDLAEGMTEEQLSFLRVSYESVLRLKRLVTHLVDIAALESGKLHVDMGRVELAAVLHQLEEEMAALALSMQVDLAVELPAVVPAVRADLQRLTQVLRNVIENAIRFTPQGGSVTVQVVDAEADPRRPDTVGVRVKDTGVGIPPEQLDSVFEEFVQARRPPHGRPLGAGLGLPICKRLIELLGGTIEVTSTDDAGTAVTITVPRSPEDSP
jgi:signal transduction histidine kinase